MGYINIKKENYKSIILKNVPIAYGMRKRDISFKINESFFFIRCLTVYKRKTVKK